MNKLKFWQSWLYLLTIGMTFFGIFIALFNQSSVFDLFNQQINPVFWSVTDPGLSEAQFQGWLYGVWGATISGMGLLAAFITRYAFPRREKWARNGLLAGILVWFVLDTGISISYRVNFNAVFNIVLFILISIPLLLTWNEFKA
jgi:hypothetical protein